MTRKVNYYSRKYHTQNNNPHNKKAQKHPQTTILSPLINPTKTKKNPIQTLITKTFYTYKLQVQSKKSVYLSIILMLL
jgi:hypothetical protein